ncbi:uncharacterized protein RHOBADRAFT_55536 [Rhodotorula graminis WP1]|uniref:Carrier domain-containing protein n=1 Tax=Rhodotorula graminis (strain WP1) TaxID=578459 RepID=A0A0P9GIN8_RHOGW|nr:uncharacterized protein RHOBADRAFT_55536 [Rhodotorula graminis WP1]KPV72864.1 hypothetical protein RHOBADRAFT_55536 [Rhodotorula graminis WP1]
MPPPDYPRLPTSYTLDRARLDTIHLSSPAPPPSRDRDLDLDRAVRAAAALALAAHAGEDRFAFAVTGGAIVQGELDLAASLDRLLAQVEVGHDDDSALEGADAPRLAVFAQGEGRGPAARPPAPLQLEHALVDDGKRLAFVLTSDTSVVPRLEAQWFLEHVHTAALDILTADHDRPLSSVALAPPHEAQALERYSSCPSTIHEPDAYPPSVNTLASFFLHAAQRHPDDPALHFIPSPSEPDRAGALRLSYAQLSHLAHFLAAHLLLSSPYPTSTGAAPRNGALVLPIVVDKSPAMVVSLLAASLAGYGYLALEPSFPAARKEGICAELADKGMLASAALVQGTDGERARWERMTRDGDSSSAKPLFRAVVDPAELLAPLLDFAAAHESSSAAAGDELARRFPVPSVEGVGGWPLVEEDDLAYVIYTSGTTGKPKGIMVEQRNVAAFLRNYRGVFGRARGERVLQFPSYSFDVSVMNIWDTFAHGATLCLTTPSSLYSSLADSILALECTLVDLTPTIGAILFEHDEAQSREGESVRDAWRRAGFKIKQVNTGGEKVEKAVRDKWRERGVRVCIDYGPTETTVGVISNQSLSPSPPAPFSLPIGRPTGSTRIHILPPSSSTSSPSSLRPLPLGCIGEICVLGAQVTRGYVRAELNAGVFVASDGSEGIGEKGEVVYRTGDLGRWVVAEWEGEGEQEGWIECLGRKDGQVKVNGLRIEVGEIEENLSSKANPAVSRGIVDKVELPSLGTALVAFLELSPSFRPPSSTTAEAHHSHSAGAIEIMPLTSTSTFADLTEDLKARLADKLPGYMVPRYWLAVNRIPTQGMGKADRKALRSLAEAFDFRGATRAQRPSTSNGTTELVEDDERTHTRSPAFDAARRAWAKILRLADEDGAASIADQDSFTKLGGDSIRFMKLVGALRAEGYRRVTFRDLAEAATLSACAAALERVGADSAGPAENGTSTTAAPVDTPYERFSLIPAAQHDALFAELATSSPPLPRARIADVYPTSPAQDALLAPSFDSPRGHYYAQAVYAVPVVEAQLPLDKLQRCVRELVRRHDVLREVFVVSETLERTIAVVLEAEDEEVRRQVEIERVEVREGEKVDEVVGDWLRRDREAHSFQWGRLSLSFALFSLINGDRKLAWSMHHAMSDGWTLELLTADLRDLCFGLSPPSRPSFGNVAGWWLGESSPPQDTVDFWRGYLDGARPLGWPSQAPLDGDMLATTGAAIQHWSGELDALSHKHGITPAIASRVAILVALQHHAQSSDVNVGIVRSGRDIDVVDADEIIGPCVSVLPSRIRFDESRSSSLLSLARAEAEADRRARLHQHVTLSQLASVCDLAGGRADLFDILVTFQSLAERDPAFDEAAPWPIRQPPERIHMPTNYTLSFEVTPEMHDKDRLELACFFDERIVDQAEVEAVLKSVATVLDYLTTAPCTTVEDVKLVGDAASDLARAKRATTSDAAARAGSAAAPPVELDGETVEYVERLKREWAAVLRVDEGEIGAHDSFSSLGGDSISTMRLAVRLKKVGLAVPTQQLSKLPTVAQQAQWLRQKAAQ